MTRIMYQTGILILVFTSLANPSCGQFHSASGGRAIGMAGAGLVLEDEYAMFNNPGALQSEELAFLLSYIARYITMGISDAQVGIGLPIGSFNGGIGISYYGDELYNQIEVAVTGSHEVGFATLGARFSYRQFYLENYGYKRTAAIDIGGVFKFSEQLKLAMLITNLTRSQLANEQDYRLSSILALGVAYQPLNSFRIDLQVTKDINQPVSGELGIEYMLNDNVSVRTGFNFTNSLGALGLGLRWQQFRLDLAGSYQPRLGYGAVLSLIITRRNDN